MTVQELLDNLNEVENKGAEVVLSVGLLHVLPARFHDEPTRNRVLLFTPRVDDDIHQVETFGPL